ncbi:MAG: MmcQ/YjbR family DNA-binding protein [Marmoricola sp.]
MTSERAARPEDVDDICGSLPEAWFGTSWGDVPTWLVPEAASRRGKGKGFVLYRKPHKTAIDPATGELFDDLLVIRTPSAAEKEALVADDGPFFTVDHFNGFNAVLVQQSRLSEISVDELREVITDAWRTMAPKSVVRAHPDV